MRIVFNKDVLVNTIEQNCGILSSKPSFMTLMNILVRVKNNKCSFVTTDLVNTMITNIDVVSCDGEGEFLINGKNVLSIFKTLTEETVCIDVEDNIFVQCGSFKAKFNKQDTQDYPSVEDDVGLDYGLKFKASELVNALNFVLPSVSIDQTRPCFCGINFNYTFCDKKAIVSLCATDGHRLAKTNVIAEDLQAKEPQENGYIIQSNVAALISKWFNINEDIKLILDSTSATFKSSTTTIKTKLIDGGFPDFSKVIPNTDVNIIINKKSLANPLKRSLALNTKKPVAKLSFSSNKLTITTVDNALGSLVDDIECNYEGKDLDIALNSKYLEQALNVIDDTCVCMGVIDNDSPIKLISESDFNAKDESQVLIIMPMSCL